MDYRDYFQTAMGADTPPYPYQTRLVTEPWPDLLDIPTGLGKTAAVTLAWLYKRGWRAGGARTIPEPQTPRRLIWCLPMRVLVEQTEQNIRGWLSNLGCLGEKAGDGKVSVHLLMGGEDDLKSWAEWPEEEMILIGTQDMLLSRALMRGYGMSRYQWPVQFALLHTDAFWVFDEVQLMGAGLPTSSQIEAFRRDLKTAATSKTLWISATLKRAWLDSVDFRPHIPELSVHELTDAEKTTPAVQRRRQAPKRIAAATTTLDNNTAKGGQKGYVEQLSAEILDTHPGTAPTLVILNNVQRAQNLYTELKKRLKKLASGPDIMLLHARFRHMERAALNRRVLELGQQDNTIVIATQALEAGVDISSHTLFTELAPCSSLVQRFGRCNRAGEHPDSRVFWIDIQSDLKLSVPYTDDELDASRSILLQLASAAPADLPPPSDSIPLYQIIRRKDFLELFNTDADLSGFDIDISPWIRDNGSPQIQVYWRDFAETPIDQSAPGRDELCPVSLSQIRDHMKSLEGFTWDTLGRRWERANNSRIRPGQTILLRCADGGYSPLLGFKPRHKDKKAPVTAIPSRDTELEDYEDDRLTQLGRFVTLQTHLGDAAREAELLCDAVIENEHRASVHLAARWHDTGKAHAAFQNMLMTNAVTLPHDKSVLWAKNDNNRFKRPLRLSCDRRYFRHELASMLAWLSHGTKKRHQDLIAYLILAHHGRVRMGIRALPAERGPDDDRRFARGVWDGDTLPGIDLGGESIPETLLQLDIMELGEGAMGPSWATRTQGLLREHGPFRLAWLETLVRIADWRASRKEQEQ